MQLITRAYLVVGTAALIAIWASGFGHYGGGIANDLAVAVIQIATPIPMFLIMRFFWKELW